MFFISRLTDDWMKFCRLIKTSNRDSEFCLRDGIINNDVSIGSLSREQIGQMKAKMMNELESMRLVDDDRFQAKRCLDSNCNEVESAPYGDFFEAFSKMTDARDSLVQRANDAMRKWKPKRATSVQDGPLAQCHLNDALFLLCERTGAGRDLSDLRNLSDRREFNDFISEWKDRSGIDLEVDAIGLRMDEAKAVLKLLATLPGCCGDIQCRDAIAKEVGGSLVPDPATSGPSAQ